MVIAKSMSLTSAAACRSLRLCTTSSCWWSVSASASCSGCSARVVRLLRPRSSHWSASPAWRPSPPRSRGCCRQRSWALAEQFAQGPSTGVSRASRSRAACPAPSLAPLHRHKSAGTGCWCCPV